jgi:hypothetical protein
LNFFSQNPLLFSKWASKNKNIDNAISVTLKISCIIPLPPYPEKVSIALFPWPALILHGNAQVFQTPLPTKIQAGDLFVDAAGYFAWYGV